MSALVDPRFQSFMNKLDPTGATYRRICVQARYVFEPHLAEIKGARVLDVGAGDGRWSALAACSGAAEVIALDARAEHAARFDMAADAELPEVAFEIVDMFEALRRFAAERCCFDVVFLFGVLFHTTDHVHLLRLVLTVSSRLILLDSEISQMKGSAIIVATEPTDDPMNALGNEREARALVGVPTRKALETMCQVLGCGLQWHDWDDLTDAERPLVGEYCRTGSIRRQTCALWPGTKDAPSGQAS